MSQPSTVTFDLGMSHSQSLRDGVAVYASSHNGRQIKVIESPAGFRGNYTGVCFLPDGLMFTSGWYSVDGAAKGIKIMVSQPDRFANRKLSWSESW